MSELTEHYRVLLGLDANWRVEQVHFSLEAKKVEIRLAHIGDSLCCPECGALCPQARPATAVAATGFDAAPDDHPLADSAEQVPPVRREDHRRSSADKDSRFTLLFEAMPLEC